MVEKAMIVALSIGAISSLLLQIKILSRQRASPK